MPAFVPHDEWIKEKDPAEGGRPNLFAETMGETIQKRGCCTRDQKISDVTATSSKKSSFLLKFERYSSLLF